MSTAILAKGSKLYRRNPTTSVWEAVPQATVLNAPAITQDFDDITNHDSSGGYKEYVATLRDGGELGIELLWDVVNIPAHGVLYDDAVAEPLPVRSWAIMLPNLLNGWSFSAYLTSPNVPLDFTRAIRASFNLRVTGQPTRLTAGLPA